MKEKLSAVLDGDLDLADSGKLIDRLGSDSDLRERWQAYCLIGDAIRGETPSAGDVFGRVMDALEDEPTVLAPARRTSVDSARQGIFDRFLPIAASVMGIAAVGWIAVSLNADSRPAGFTAPSLASLDRGAGAVERPAQVSLPVDPHREYVFIHQASAGNGPIPGVAQYVRSVSETHLGGDQ